MEGGFVEGEKGKERGKGVKEEDRGDEDGKGDGRGKEGRECVRNEHGISQHTNRIVLSSE